MIPKDLIVDIAKSLGFSFVGVAKADAVDEVSANAFKSWLKLGKHAEMHFLENHLDKRLDPRLLLPGCKTIVCVAMNYYPSSFLLPDTYQFAYYAYGKDYHNLMKERLSDLDKCIERIVALPRMTDQDLSSEVSFSFYDSKICVDTVPILERYWAQKAGLGWQGKSGQFIIPKAGSYFFLGEILINQAVTDYDTPINHRCGSCSRCIDACPTQAITGDGQVDSRRCLSYLTIEYRGEFSQEMINKLDNNTIYGCDICAKACPWNYYATPTKETSFNLSDELIAFRKEDWEELSQENYQKIFKGSAVKRVKYNGLLRNIRALRDKEK